MSKLIGRKVKVTHDGYEISFNCLYFAEKGSVVTLLKEPECWGEEGTPLCALTVSEDRKQFQWIPLEALRYMNNKPVVA